MVKIDNEKVMNQKERWLMMTKFRDAQVKRNVEGEAQ